MPSAQTREAPAEPQDEDLPYPRQSEEGEFEFEPTIVLGRE